ncbi:MAG: substrate-binding domain-containing protein [Planctomycetia bacterium]|nr:substrate-binding domain-containing protein [Planctomycetia bacterium]
MIDRMGPVLLLLMSVVCCGCTRSGAAPDQQFETRDQGHGTIAISYLTGENPFFTTVADTIKHQARESGYSVMSVDAQNDPFRQTCQVRDFIRSNVVAIILIPCNSKEIGPAVREANEAGIPVFTADVAVQDPLAKVVCHVATDNYCGGKLAAEEILEAIHRTGKVAIVDWPGIESVQMRTKGFREVIAFANKEGAKVEIVSCMPAYGSREKAKLAMREILNDCPDLNAVFAINDPTAFGVLDVLTEKGLAQKVQVISFDGTEEAKRLVNAERFFSDIVQKPEEIGKITFNVCHMYLTGESVSSQVLIPPETFRGSINSERTKEE